MIKLTKAHRLKRLCNDYNNDKIDLIEIKKFLKIASNGKDRLKLNVWKIHTAIFMSGVRGIEKEYININWSSYFFNIYQAGKSIAEKYNEKNKQFKIF